jgi:hypothetical protein
MDRGREAEWEDEHWMPSGWAGQRDRAVIQT